ncbi:MAG: sigma-54 dependent transcriptional regulator [Planctomycetaceae bacterium]|nr:sigma-54 dependent transcriptional regulator [Planctomycetaceae bacterium]
MISHSEAETVFIIDDDPVIRTTFCKSLEDAGFQVHAFADAESALLQMTDSVAAVLLDLRLPQTQGLQCLKLLRRQFPDTCVIVVSGSADVGDIVSSMKGGAVNYLRKPVDAGEMVQATVAALQDHSSRHGAALTDLSASSPEELLIGPALLSDMGQAAKLNSSVFLMGESGTGKTLAANWIHNRSPRADFRMVSLNCAALPHELAESELFGHTKGAFTGADRHRPGKVEHADRGTLFLDEIGDLPLAVQPKLLTFLQDRRASRVGSNDAYSCDVRIICATHRNLASMCEQGEFREDLYYRLNVLPVHLPPLRERHEELAGICRILIARICRRFQCREPFLSDPALHMLTRHNWPGNIRELENVLERAVAFLRGDVIEHTDIRILSANRNDDSPRPSSAAAGVRTLVELERQAIIDALNQFGGNKAQTARELGISEKSIYNKMKRLGIRAGSTSSDSR